MKRLLKSNENRPNYAKRAKAFGLQHVSVTNIQRYLKRDWEKRIELTKRRFDYNYLVRYLLIDSVYEMEFTLYLDLYNELIRNGLSTPYMQMMREKRFKKLRDKISKKEAIIRKNKQNKTNIPSRID